MSEPAAAAQHQPRRQRESDDHGNRDPHRLSTVTTVSAVTLGCPSAAGSVEDRPVLTKQRGHRRSLWLGPGDPVL